ncbi:HNH endonuclease signature motif containing protein [Tsukamurella sp. 1534]|uniref:HNH endonuclease signature motif containing protein n=1 Tax=Tsukamurella sp. 1534 TaxID=1151061 RepID=UPI0006ACA87E|nr:HNH endonuclease signature motif containing protein [Tsukamurella sp. 1534]
MTAWLLSISRKFPQHLQYAMEKGFWDMKEAADVRRGDELYFRLSRASLVGVLRATSDMYQSDSAGRLLQDANPTWDGGGPYAARVDVEPVSVTSVRQPGYETLLEEAGYKRTYTMGLTRVLPVRRAAGQQFLRSCFFYGSAVDLSPEPVTPHLFTTGPVHRRTVEVASREGQDLFREKLLDAYGGRCALSGTAVEGTLDGAHIIEHRDNGVNECWNGLLLRADIHRLFDRSLIRVRSRGRIEVDLSLAGTEYATFTRLRQPLKAENQPLRSAFAHRWVHKNGRDLADF